MKRTHLSLMIALLAGAPACTAPDVPETPSFQVHVLPILAANCVRCHGSPTLGGAPDYTRWDSFENLRATDELVGPCGELVCGASTLASGIAMRVAASDNPMPPRFPLEDHQIDTLARWAEQGGLRGEPRPGNARPTIEVEPLGQDGAMVTLAIEVADADFDLVVGELFAEVGATRTFVQPLRSGRYELAWDTSALPMRGSFPLVARLDDGAGFTDHVLGSVEVQ